jgi:hypothetical protein
MTQLAVAIRNSQDMYILDVLFVDRDDFIDNFIRID